MEQDAAGGAGMQVGAIEGGGVGAGGHAALGGLDSGAALGGEFLGKDVFQAARTGGEDGACGHDGGFIK